jgi:hypothetical protein
MGNGNPNRRTQKRRASDLLKAELPLHVAYLILIIRLLALLNVQLHIVPTEPASAIPVLQSEAARTDTAALDP